jgi:hypothetical protein
MSDVKAQIDPRRTFEGRYRKQQNYARLVQKWQDGRLITLTGMGRRFLSFRARAPSAECPVADEATYSTSRRLWICQLALGAGVGQGKRTGKRSG